MELALALTRFAEAIAADPAVSDAARRAAEDLRSAAFDEAERLRIHLESYSDE